MGVLKIYSRAVESDCEAAGFSPYRKENAACAASFSLAKSTLQSRDWSLESDVDAFTE